MEFFNHLIGLIAWFLSAIGIMAIFKHGLRSFGPSKPATGPASHGHDATAFPHAATR